MTSIAMLDTPRESLALPSTAGLDLLDDEQLLARQREFAAARRVVDSGAARVAAEIERRSRRELGHRGLAQRRGAGAAPRLVERLAGVSPGEASTLVAVGGMLEDVAQGASPWLRGVATAVDEGAISVAAARVIGDGLGAPSASVDAETLADLARRLVAAADDMTLRGLAAEARTLRDGVDQVGIDEREELRRQRRFLRLTPLDDGMTRVSGLLDPESAAIVTAAFDQVTAPRRGGPRFVDADDAARARRIVEDPRTTDQLVADALVDMVRIASAADPGTVFGQRRPAVQLHVEREHFESGCGGARLEGQSAAVSVATARRLTCASGVVPIIFDGVDAIDVGRAQRTFTARQRVALAATWGGCAWPGCDRPPSWTEAHHVEPWSRGGATDLRNGVLLCRFHHLHVHNLGWRLERRRREVIAIPPPGDDGGQLVLAPSAYRGEVADFRG